MKVFTSKTQQIGEHGEEVAIAYLKKQGFRIMERNAANKFGEIDIVAQKKGTYYFFEVKAGNRGGYINPAENLHKTKIRKFLISSEYYALVHKIKDYRVQGVIVLFDRDKEADIETIDLS